MTQPAITNSRDFFLADEPKTLFPMALSRLLIEKFHSRLLDHIAKVLDPARKEYAFLAQQRVYAAKERHHTRRTVKLDPVAEFYIYDVVYRNRNLFRKPYSDNRKHFGYRFEGGAPLAGVDAYASFKSSVFIEQIFHRYNMSFDIQSYFNNIYHHDLVHWFRSIGASKEDVDSMSLFLREINAGRSIDCLPHGLYPCKMLGNGFLSFMDTSNRLRSSVMCRFMDDVQLFDNDAQVLLDDFYCIQSLLGEKGLSINSAKTCLPGEVGAVHPGGMLDIKKELLQKRRHALSHYGEDAAGKGDALTEAQREYLLSLLKSDALEEDDAELVLALMQNVEDVLDYVPVLASSFPNLAKRFYQFCSPIKDKQSLAVALLALLKGPSSLTEFQLFWLANTVEDYLLGTSVAGELLSALLKHKNSSVVSTARVLEIPENRFGMIEIRESYLRSGCSDWRAWASAMGSRKVAKAQRNYVLDYFGKASLVNYLIAECVSQM